MALLNPWGHDSISFNGENMRQVIDAVFTGQGVVGISDFLVSAQGTPAATVSVAAGDLVLASSHAGEGGKYLVSNDAALNSPSFTPTSANGRKDRLILRITAGVAALEIVQGTASGTPAEPTITGDNFIELALITWNPSTSVVSAGMITDRRIVATSVSGIPTASYMQYAGSTEPAGWYFAAGQTKSRTTDARLYAALGGASSPYGQGDGSTTFNLPNVRGCTLVALDNMGGSDRGLLDVANTLGAQGGEQYHLLTSGESGLRDHSHAAPNAGQFMIWHGNANTGTVSLGTDFTVGAASTNGSGAFNAVSAHNNMPPYVLCNTLIKN